MKKSQFSYDLPTDLIAQIPLTDRSASRLLVIDTPSKRFEDKQFTDFIDLINDKDLLVFNNTKVIPARLFGKKNTGGHIEILIERIIDNYKAIAHVKASKTPKPGALIHLDGGYRCSVLSRVDNLFELQFSSEITALLQNIGHIPLPPYIKRADDNEDSIRYQTVFAKEMGAVAAPTAGLHFDLAMMDKLKQKGIATAFVTLHVGSGTFQPVRVENLEEHIMHQEYFAVPHETVAAILQAKAHGGRVIAIGTTAVRALESACQQGGITAGVGDTALFITPGYHFKVVDALLTNFHLPESTLLMLVSAFAGYDTIMQAYRYAITQSYRFFSYGDAMFITAKK